MVGNRFGRIEPSGMTGRHEERSVRARSGSVRAMSSAVAPDDIVQTHAQARENARPPLLVLDPLREFLDAHGLGEGELQASPIGEGHSNVTYLIRRTDGSELVLRRPPRPPLPPSAHDVLREARLLRALQGTQARVPSVLAVEDDPATIGCPFYVMERVEGEAIVFTLPPALDAPAERRRIAEELIDALVEIHGVDWRAAGLEDFGKPTGYLERQLRRFGGLWEINKTREIPAVERVAEWLAKHLPESGSATIVHGDYRLGNTMFATDAPARLTAVLDWEMATIGDPLADLGLHVHGVGPGRRPARRHQGFAGRGHEGRGLPHPRGADRALRSAKRALDERPALVCDAGGVEDDGVHGGQLQAGARWRHRRPLSEALRRGRAAAGRPRGGGDAR